MNSEYRGSHILFRLEGVLITRPFTSEIRFTSTVRVVAGPSLPPAGGLRNNRAHAVREIHFDLPLRDSVLPGQHFMAATLRLELTTPLGGEVGL